MAASPARYLARRNAHPPIHQRRLFQLQQHSILPPLRERGLVSVCGAREGGRGDHSKSPLFWSTNLQQGREEASAVNFILDPLSSLPLTQSSSPFLSVPLLSPLTVGQMQQGFFNSFFPILISGTSTWSTDVGAFLDSKNLQVLGFHCTFLPAPYEITPNQIMNHEPKRWIWEGDGEAAAREREG